MHEIQIALDEATTVGHAMSLALVLAQGACPISLLCGDLIAAERFINLLLKHAMHHALYLWHGWGKCLNAMLAIERGNTGDGLKALRGALDELPEGAFFAQYAGIHAVLAETLGKVGEISNGHATIDAALERAERDAERWYVAEFLRIKGELLHLEGTPAATRKAEERLQSSLDCARRQDALSWELRTSLSLARLYQEQGRSIEAREVLVPVYSRFNEGFQTADLRTAKALMEVLGRAPIR
jgi:predicted ATPase